MLWTRICPKHCSDEFLLGHADGELPWFREVRVRKHLQRCWECRARLAELEALAETVATSFADTTFLGPEGMGRARSHFLEAEERYEALRRAPGLSLMPNRIPRAAGAAALMVACLAAIAFWPARSTDPAALLAAARNAERAWRESQPILHARVRVEFAEIRPVPRRRSGSVEMWSDRDGRYALRWTDGRGALQYAVWRPGATGRERVFRAAGAGAEQGMSGPAALARLLDEEPTLGRLESAFLAWLGSHDWRPLELTGHVALFASGGGVTMRAERARGGGGRQIGRASCRERV